MDNLRDLVNGAGCDDGTQRYLARRVFNTFVCLILVSLCRNRNALGRFMDHMTRDTSQREQVCWCVRAYPLFAWAVSARACAFVLLVCELSSSYWLSTFTARVGATAWERRNACISWRSTEHTNNGHPATGTTATTTLPTITTTITITKYKQ